MTEKIVILDFGSQFTQIIGRRVREFNVYCEIHPFNNVPELDETVKGVILSGSPYSVRDAQAPQIDLSQIKGRLPLLAICYGAQYIAHRYGGEVNASSTREYGRAMLEIKESGEPIFKNVPVRSQVWMSHGDSINRLPEGAELIASTSDVKYAAYKIKGENTYAFQFHPEVFHSEMGGQMIKNFLFSVCGCRGEWTPDSFIESTVAELKEKLGDDSVILGLSGGVDSTVAAVLLNKAIGKNLHCIFVDNGLLRNARIDRWEDLFRELARVCTADRERTVIVIDEFQYLGKANPAYPSIFQRVWDTMLKDANVMLILCGSLISLMRDQVLSEESPLYGRRTAQIRMGQIPFSHYREFLPGRSTRELVGRYAVTGGVPKYIELFEDEKDVYSAISANVLDRSGFLYDEPNFLLQRENVGQGVCINARARRVGELEACAAL